MERHLKIGLYKEINKRSLTVMNVMKKNCCIELTKLIRENRLGESTLFIIKLKSTKCPRMYGKIKIHKDGFPIRPIADFIDSPTYNLAKFLSNLLKTLYGQTVHHISKTQDFVEKLKIEDGIMISFDVSSLFTNVPREEALRIVLNKLTMQHYVNEPALLQPT